MVAVRALQLLSRDAEVPAGLPFVHATLHGPGNGRMAQVVTGAMVDSGRLQERFPGRLDARYPVPMDFHHVPLAVRFPPFQVREQATG